MNTQTYYDDEIDLREYLAVIVKRWPIIILLVIVSVASAAFCTFKQPTTYQAVATIMPLTSETGALSGLSAFIGSGASSSPGSDKIMAALTSRTLAEKVVSEYNLLKVIYKDSWDKEKNSWKAEKPPTLRNAAESLSGQIKSKAGKNDLVEVSIVWTDSKESAFIVNCYIKELGKFLNERFLNVNFKTVDNALEPENKYGPKVKQNLLIASVLGLFMGVFLVFFMEYWEKSVKRPSTIDHRP
jgi:uncharacterized protein involved in exopolysaccharide biosynthesis